jgi:hypothetical protein
MFLFVHNVCGGLEIIKTDYQHEEVISGDHRVMFEFHLETIQGSSETETAVKNLIYQGLSIDDYIAHKINWFMGHPENLDYEYISPRLTDKGKELMRTILQ